ncbi:hypothetical protein DH2020_040676 [Rehmannia glutinosa]|uniref:R2R3-MYB protein n=1 Tax=Rehmannia glutinosa TaxID=99300 RepID=A0ABR0UTJ9_REHGL
METFRTNGSGANCRRRRHTKWRWTFEEDDSLTELVKKHRPRSWDYIAYHMQGRSGKSCRLRWINQLNPKVNKKPFSGEERQKLLELQKKYGNRWSTIVRHFPGRTDNQVKNQYHSLVGTRYMKPSGPSSTINPHGPLMRGSIGSSLYGNISTVPVGSLFSNEGNNYCGFAPSYNAMSNRIEMMPVFGGGFGVHSFSGVNLANIYSNKGIGHGDSMMSDAKSAAFSEGVGAKEYQFIDFMGVGSSE